MEKTSNDLNMPKQKKCEDCVTTKTKFLKTGDDPIQITPKSSFQLEPSSYSRFTIQNVTLNNEERQLLLDLTSNDTKEQYKAILCGIWFFSNVLKGDVIHLIEANFSENKRTYVIDNEKGSIVVNPDLLLTSTNVSQANFCMRKAWLGSKFGGWFSQNTAMLIGTIVHQLFQEACVKKISSDTDLKKALVQIVKNKQILENCYAAGISSKELANQLLKFLPLIMTWIKKYILEGPSSIESGEKSVKVVKVHDIEENIWDIKHGLKGKVDATLEVQIHTKTNKFKTIVPLELKTGRASFSNEHRGQVLLYALMLESLYNTGEGLLLYLNEEPRMQDVQLSHGNKRDLIKLRNDLTFYLSKHIDGPIQKNNERLCSKCDHLTDCSLMLQTFEKDKLDTSNVQSLYRNATAHLNPNHIEFFKKWISMLNLEAEEQTSSKVAFWTQSSEINESRGLTISKVTVKQSENLNYTFKRHAEFIKLLGPISENQVKRGERICISLDQIEKTEKFVTESFVQWGYVVGFEEHEIIVILDKVFPERFSEQNIFRIDYVFYEFSQIFNYTNLLRLMTSDPIAGNLRKFIIDQQSPNFRPKLSKEIVLYGKKILKVLNEPQKRAVIKALASDDFCLIHGTPGAGKTETIVALVQLLVKLEQTIMITAFTHTAVDNILLKLKEFGVDFLRIGLVHRFHPDLAHYSVEEKAKNFNKVSELDNFYKNVQIVAGTCHGISNHPIFEKRIFDFCIVDEASQVLLPVCLGPLFHSKKFLLVGDPKQLPPIVRGQAKKEGLDESLFVILQNEHNTVNLNVQYRMNEEIMRLANELTYGNTLECGLTSIAKNCLKEDWVSEENNWLNITLSGNLSHSVIFINTNDIESCYGNKEEENGVYFNTLEIEIIKLLTTNLLEKYPLDERDLGIITPFQKQVKYLKESLKDKANLEINTVDQYQGRDKEVIIFSSVKSCSVAKVSDFDLLNDERRLNVTITRAKKKLIMIGNKTKLDDYEPFKRLFKILKPYQYITLPKDWQDFKI